MTKDDNTKVCVAINAVQNALKAGIPKDHKNAMQGYNFRGIDDIYNVVGPLLPEHGLVILPRMLSRECEVHKNAKGNTMFHVVVKAEYRFKATADGSCEVVEMYGEAMDSSDKATNKAMSAAYKYACIQTFSIPVTGEPDADADSPQVPADTAQEQVGRTPRGKSPAPAAETPSRGVQRKETPSEEDVTEWRGWLTEVRAHDSKDNPKYTGKPYMLYRVTMNDGKTATTFNEKLFTKAQFIATKDDEVIVKVVPNIRGKPGTWELRDIERAQSDESESELELAGAEKNEDPY